MPMTTFPTEALRPDETQFSGRYRYPKGKDGAPSFTLHVDIDGRDPLNVVSCTFDSDEQCEGMGEHCHFVGRVQKNVPTMLGRGLVAGNFEVTWPGSAALIDRLEILLRYSAENQLWCDVSFYDKSQARIYGPFSAPRELAWFREVELEIAIEVGAAPVEPYDTHAHPDRPASLVREKQTIADALAKAGIHVIRPSRDHIINQTEAGENGRWSTMELHDSMQLHWDSSAAKTGWRLWLLLACLSEHERMAGTMFDGLGRQGVAIFTRCRYFHEPDGGYVRMNPPVEPAAKRELFFNTIHELGHAFNLSHPSEREGRPWKGPAWMRRRNNRRAVTWMNYPDYPTRHDAGANATWFYKRFAFQFDKHDLTFLRHAPESWVAPGRKAWFRDLNRASPGHIDPRLRVWLRRGKRTYELGEPIIVELTVSNVGDERILVHSNLDPGEGLVAIWVTAPDGMRRLHTPLIHRRVVPQMHTLRPGEALPLASVNITAGASGFSFENPGAYQITAGYFNLDGNSQTASVSLYVRPPGDPDTASVVREIFDPRVGWVLQAGGTRALMDVNEEFDWIRGRLGPRNPISCHLAALRYLPLARATNVIEPGVSSRTLLNSEPDRVVQHLGALVFEQSCISATTLGRVRFRDLIDTFARAAREVGDYRLAREAHERLRSLPTDSDAQQYKGA
jgi:hypothetical protein